MRRYIAIFLGGLLLACNEKVKHVDSAQLLCDTLTLQNVGNVRAIQVGYRLDSPIIAYIKRDKQWILFYNTENRRIVDSIPVHYEFDKNDKFYVKEDRSVLLFTNGQNKIFKLSDTNRQEIIYRTTSKPVRVLEFVSLAFNMQDRYVMLYEVPNVNVGETENRTIYFNSKILTVFSIDGDSLVPILRTAPFPENYKAHFYYEFYPVATMANNKVYYAFTNSSIVSEINIQDGATKAYDVKDLNGQNEPFDLKKLFDYGFAKDYRLAASRNMQLITDGKTGKIALIQEQAIIRDSNALIQEGFEDKPVSIFVLDKDKKIESIIKFPHQKVLDFEQAFLSNNLLYVPAKKNETGTDNKKIFLYEIP